jgi:hypothetical protein
MDSATVGNAQATVAFAAPAFDGNLHITSYTVTAADSTTPANGGETASGSSSPITVTGLTNGDSYTFTVTATNAVGTGSPSAPSNAVVPGLVPGAPTIGTATPGDLQATITFAPPESSGTSPITSYTVTAADSTTPANGGETASGSSSPITLTGLTNGDSYTFTVTATNAVGTGPPSAPSNAVVPAAPLTITSLTPGQLPEGAFKVDVAIEGSGFVSPATVSISGTHVIPTLVSVAPGTIIIDVTVGATASLGARDVTVSDANGSATCTGCLTITTHPTLTRASPSQVAAGTSSTVTFTGSGFDAADHQNSPLSITEIPQGSERRGGLDLSLRGCQGATS